MSVQWVEPSAVLRLAPGIRLKHDRVRDRQVVLGPEMLVDLNATGFAILSAIDGQSSVDALIQRLATQFGVTTDVIRQDVVEFCTGMLLRQVLTR